MSHNNKLRISSIDGLRAISILFVLIDHYIYFSGNNFLNPYFSFLINGKNGVDIFFIISGFLITTILVKEHLRDGQISLTTFFLRRAFRILPALYFLLFIYFILSKSNVIHFSMQTLLNSIFLVSQLKGVRWENFHLWSLSVENIFYILLPLFLNRFKNIPYVKIFYSSIILLLILPFIRYYFYTQTNLSTFNIFFRCEGLIFGVLIALITLFVQPKIKFSHISLVFISTVVIIILINFISSFNNSITLNYILKQYSSILYVFVFALLFWCVINLKTGIIYSILNNSILTFIGIISYSLYLWQQLFFSRNDIFHFDNIFFRLISLFFISICSYYFIESPFSRLKTRIK